MSGLELFTKTAARRLFLKDKLTLLTAAEIRRGGWSNELDYSTQTQKISARYQYHFHCHQLIQSY